MDNDYDSHDSEHDSDDSEEDEEERGGQTVADLYCPPQTSLDHLMGDDMDINWDNDKRNELI